MATINQRLAFIISANAEQAVKAFEKTANTADKQMKKASKSIDKVGVSLTKFGAAGLAAAGTLGAGLFKLAEGAIADQKAQALLAQQIKNSTNATNEQVAAIEEMIKKTASATGIMDDELRPSYSNLIRATSSTAKSQRLFALAMDLSAATGKDLASVTIALGKASNGQVSALTRMGIPLDANIVKAKDSEAAFAQLEKRVGGSAAIAADTYAGKLLRMKNALSEAGEEIGAQFIPVVEMGANIVTKSVGAFTNLNTATNGAIGKFASLGTVALGVVSSLSLVAGQTIKMRDRFIGADGSLNTFGKSARGVTVALGALAAASVAAEVIAKLGNYGQQVEDKFNKLQITLADTGSTSKDVTTDFANLANRLKETDTSGFGVGAMLKQVGKAIRVAGADTDAGRIAVEYLEQAFTDISKSSPVAAQRVIDALLSEASAMDKTSAGYKDNTKLASRFQTQLNLLTGAQEANNNMTLDGVDAGEKQLSIYSRFMTAIPTVKDALKAAEDRSKAYAEKQREAAAAAEAFKNKIMSAADVLKTKMNKALDVASANAKKAKDDFDAYASSIASFITAGVSVSSAQEIATENTKNLASANAKVAETYKDLQLARAKGDVEGIASATQAWSDATKELGIAQQAPTSFLDVLRGQAADAAKFGENLLSLKGLGLTEAAFAQIAGAGTEVGNQIATSILSGADPAGKVAEINGLIAGTQKIADDVGKAAAATYKQSGVDLANSLLAGVSETVAKYQLKLQWKNLKKLKKPIKSIGDLTSAFAEDITGQFKLGNLDVPELAEGGIVKPRSGGTMVRLGEAGQSEAVIPLPAKGIGGNTYNITIEVNGSDPNAVVAALRSYMRQNGSIPIKTSTIF